MCKNGERCGHADGLNEPIPEECKEICTDLVPIEDDPRQVLDRAVIDRLVREPANA